MINQLQSLLDQSSLDLLALTPGPTLRYLTGQNFTAHERLFLLLMHRTGKLVAILPALEEDNFGRVAPANTKIFTWDDAEGPAAAASTAIAELPAVKTVGVEPLVCRFFEMGHLRHHLPDASLVSAAPMISRLRIIKSREEAEFIRRAARIAQQALDNTISSLTAGVNEAEVARRLSSELLSNGGESISFGPIVLSGPKTALPHGEPDDRVLLEGEFLLIDFGTSYRGYHCDITRTFAFRKMPPDSLVELYEAVLVANTRGREVAKPGITAGDLHAYCQSDFLDDRWREFMKHRTGHGLGLEIHEPPSIMRGDGTVLEAGMIFTVEPGLYRTDLAGVRIEDNLWLTDSGNDCLTDLPRELRVVG